MTMGDLLQFVVRPTKWKPRAEGMTKILQLAKKQAENKVEVKAKPKDENSDAGRD